MRTWGEGVRKVPGHRDQACIGRGPPICEQGDKKLHFQIREHNWLLDRPKQMHPRENYPFPDTVVYFLYYVLGLCFFFICIFPEQG